jgi:hypothetical protein
MQKKPLIRFNIIQKSYKKTRNTRNVPQHYKGYICQTYSLWGKTETISPKVRNETRMPTLPTPIQHGPGIPSQSNKEEEEEEIKGIVKASLFADDMTQRPKILHPKTPRHHKQLQQCSRIQHLLTKSVMFLHTNNEQIEK